MNALKHFRENANDVNNILNLNLESGVIFHRETGNAYYLSGGVTFDHTCTWENRPVAIMFNNDHFGYRIHPLELFSQYVRAKPSNIKSFTDFIHTSQKNINKLHALGGVEFDNELTVTVQGLIDKGLCLSP